MTAKQLHFDLPAKTALGRADFFVSPANAVAVASIDAWRDWPGRKLMLVGPSASGKTHLSHVWAAQSDATIIEARDLAGADIPALAQCNVAVEDAAMIAGHPTTEEALFHLHNLTLANGHALLVTADLAPKFWGLRLPDLASRMEGTQMAVLDAPDDTLLMAVLTKQFADRQLSPAPDVIPYLARHMDRSFEGARQIVARLDAAALDAGRPITRAFAVSVLGD